MPKSVGVKKQKEMSKARVQPTLTPEEKKAYAFYKYRITKAKEARNQMFRKFDNLDFLSDYYSNEDAMNSYLRPKRNDDEVRVVGGLTEKRIETVVNELLAMNITHEIHAYDKSDLEIEELGRNTEDLVTRTNQQEKDDDVKEEIIWELVSQRACFVEEICEELVTNDQVVKRARKRLLSSLQVFVGDVSKPAYLLNDQPYICVYERMSYWQAKTIYDNDNFKNWEFVKPGMNMDDDVFGADYTFRLGILLTEEVEVIKYMSAPDNEYQIIINGVMMLPVATKLPWKHTGYNIACGVSKRMSPHFFYGRPLTAALKYLQALNDETVRNIIRKFRQVIQPPKTVAASNKVYSRDIWEAGKITYGIPANTFTDIVTHEGVTQSELATLQLIQSMQNELAARGSTAGQTGKKQSATAILQQQQEAVKMLGLLVLSYSKIVRDLTYLRVYNVYENFTEPIGKAKDPLTAKLVDQYRQFSLKDTILENNKRGDKVINFYHRNLSPQEEDQLMEFEDSQEELGNPVRVTYINIEALQKFPITWYVTTQSKPKENDDLHKIMFSDKLEQAGKIVELSQGEQKLNSEQVVEEYQQIWRAKDWFTKPENAMQAPQDGQGQDPNQPQPGEEPQPGADGDVKVQAQAVLGKLNSLRSNNALGGVKAGVRRPAAPTSAPKEVMKKQ